MSALRCTFCGSEITPILEYRIRSYSEHRDHTGYECDDCPAEWDKHGNVTKQGGTCSFAFPTPGGLAAECGLWLPCSLHPVTGGLGANSQSAVDGNDPSQASS